MEGDYLSVSEAQTVARKYMAAINVLERWAIQASPGLWLQPPFFTTQVLLYLLILCQQQAWESTDWLALNI